MPGGLSDELAALHSRRLEAEQELRQHIFAWAMDKLNDQTLGDVRELTATLCNITSRAVMDAYNLPRPGDLPKSTESR